MAKLNLVIIAHGWVFGFGTTILGSVVAELQTNTWLPCATVAANMLIHKPS